MSDGAAAKRYVVVPGDNAFNRDMQTESTGFLKRLSTTMAGPPGFLPSESFVVSEAGRIKVLDTLDLNETALVEITDEQAHRLRMEYPGLRIAEEGRLRMLRLRPFEVTIKAIKLPKTAKRSVRITLADMASGAPIPNADLTVVLNRKTGASLEGAQTDDDGVFESRLPSSVKRIDLVLATPLSGYWPAEVNDVEVTAAGGVIEIDIRSTPIDDSFEDCLFRMTSRADPASGKGVRIAVIDGGTTPSPALKVAKGLNTTGIEPEALWDDSGSGHGTHVAGIIARLVPSAEIYAYRVFQDGAETAGEQAVAKAIRQAVDDGCDIINLSLGIEREPPAIVRETRRARAFGAVCVAASGNDWLGPVSYPARSAGVLAVSACGVWEARPDGVAVSGSVADVPAPIAVDGIGTVFFARFSNVGPEIDFIGPGVGIVSNVTADGMGVMDGTSMACPAVTGLLARSLAKETRILAGHRDQQRSDDITKVGLALARPLGFGTEYEGAGLIRA